MSKKSSNSFIGIGIGLEHDASASKQAESDIVKAGEQLSKSLITSVTKGMTPIKSALQVLTKSVVDLNTTLANIKFDSLTKGLEEVDKKTVVMAKNAKESAASIDKAVDASTKNLAKFFNIDEGSAKFKKLGEVVKESLKFDGVDKSITKITKLKDMMIQVGNEVAKVNSASSKELMANANPNMSNVKLFSVEKYNAQVEAARKEYQKLLDTAAKGNLGSTSNITNLGKQFEGYNLYTQGKNAIPNNTLDFVKELRRQIADMQRSTSNILDFNKLYSQAEKLQDKFSTLVPPTLKGRLEALTTTSWEDSIKGTAKFRAEIDRVKYAIDSLGLSLKDKGEKLWNGMAIPKTYITNVGTARSLAEDEARKRQDIQGSAHYAALRNTENFDKRSVSMNSSIAMLARDYDTLLKKVEDYKKATGVSVSLPTAPGLNNLGGITDFRGMAAAKNELADLRKHLADLIRAARTDDALNKRFEKMATDINRADVALSTYAHNIKKMYATFDNVTSRTVTNPDKLGAVSSARTSLDSVLAGVTTSTLTPAKASEITQAIRQVQLAMQEFAQTGSRVKNSTGSPFDNLFKGIPRLTVDIQVMQQQISKALAASSMSLQQLDNAQFGKITKQLKEFGYTINQTTGEIKKLQTTSEQTKGIFSWLPQSLGGMAARLAEFYSLRTVLFAVSNQMRAATKTALDLNQAVHDILAISGESKDKFSVISDSIYDIAKNSRFTAQEVASLMQVLAQAGVAASVLPTVSAEVGRFATAVASEPRTAADLATTAMNVYGIKAEQMTRITNAMTAALNLSKLEAGGLATAFNYLAPQAAQLGMSMEQTLGIVATMAQSGIKASTIGTGVSQMLKEFAAPKPRLRAMLANRGLTPDDINPMKKDFADIVQTLQDAGVKVDELFQAMETRVGRAAVTAVNLSAESFRNMTASLTGTRAALVAYDKTMEGARARMNQVQQTVNEIATAVGTHLAPVFIQLTQALRGWVTAFGAFNGSLATAVIGITSVVTAAGGLWVVAGKLVPTVVAVSGSLAAASVTAGAATASFTALNGAMKLLTVGGLLGPQAGIFLGIAAISAAVYGLGKAFDYQKNKEEEAQKARLESIDRGEKLDRTLNSIAHGTRKSSDAYSLYYKMLKEGKKHEDAVVELKKANIDISAEQRKALLEYIAEGGPHAKYVDSLLKEHKTLEGLVFLERQRRIERGSDTRAAVERYNKKSSKWDVYRKEDTINTEYESRVAAAGYGKWNPIPKKVQEKFMREAKDAEEKARKEFLSTEAADVQGASLYNQATGQETGYYALENGEPVFRPTKPPKKPEPGVKTPPGGRYTPKEHGSKFMVDMLRARKATKEAETNLKALSLDELEELYGKGKGRKVIEGLVGSEQKAEITADQLVAQLTTLKDIDEALAIYEGSRAKDQIDSKLPANKKAREQAKATLLQEVLDNKYDAEREEAARKAIDARKKESEDFVQKVEKLEDETTKKIAEAQRRNQEKIMQDGYASDPSRVDAYASYLQAEKTRLQSEADAKYGAILKSYEQKQEKGYPTTLREDKAYGDAISLMDTYVSSGVTEATEAAGRLKHTGDMASLDVKLKTEQQLLQTRKEAYALLEREAVGADTVKQLRVNALRAEDESLKQQKVILTSKQNLAKSDEESARWGAELKNIEQARVKLNFELRSLQRTSWGDFTNGAREAWNQLSDISKITKELGSSVTNSLVNGLGSTMSNAFTTLVNPDQSKIAEINAKITELRTQKSQLEADIAMIDSNSSKTPEELKNLADKKTALQGINTELGNQEQAVRKQKDAWQTFGDGMKGIMKGILQELQNYIFKLFAVWAVQKLVGLAGSIPGLSSTPGSSPMTTLQMGQANGGFASGGLIKGYAEGGMINGLPGGYLPDSMGPEPGKDSIHALLAPGEFIISRSAVQAVGVDTLTAINQKKIAKLADGGLVGGGSKMPSSNSQEGQPWSLQIVNVADPTSIPPQPVDAQQVINIVSFDISKRGTLDKVIKGTMGK